MTCWTTTFKCVPSGLHGHKTSKMPKSGLEKLRLKLRTGGRRVKVITESGARRDGREVSEGDKGPGLAL